MTNVPATTEKETVFTRVNKHGVLEEIDMISGLVVGTSDDLQVKNKYKYSIPISFAICQLIREGKTLKQISVKHNMPDLHTIYSWRATFPEFKEKLELAREDRADFYFNKVVEAGEMAEGADKADMTGIRLQSDIYKWAAEKGDPKRYGSKVSIDKKVSGNVGFYVLNTGIKREELQEEEGPVTIEVESTETINTGD